MKPRGQKTEIAFGVMPAFCRYELFLERYRCAADFIRLEYDRKDRDRKDDDGAAGTSGSASDRREAAARVASGSQPKRTRRGRLRVLDVGSGDGYMKRFCTFGDVEWHGVDIYENGLKTCRGLGYVTHRCDAATEALPFPEGSFDVVIASHVLEHLTGPEFALSQMDKVLGPGGLLIVGVPVRPYPLSRLWQLVLTLVNPRPGATRWSFDVSSFKELLRRSLGDGYAFVDVRGFRVVSARGITDWENRRSFYRWNVRLGKSCPWLTPEVNAVLRKPG